MKTAERRYDIDWVRVIAIGLLLIYHIGIAFQPWGVFIGFIQSDKSLESLWVPMSMINIWRIPLLFFVSGMGVRFAIRQRNWSQLILERAKRILVPFVFGILCIVPLHLFLWQKYYNQDLSYTVHPSHLWFLANIFIYVILLSPVFFYLKKHQDGRIHRGMKKLFKTPLGLLLIVAAFVIEAVWVNPETFETYAMTWHGFFEGLLAFLFGFIGVHTGEAFWNTLRTWRWLFLAIALGLFGLRYFQYDLLAPNYLRAIESNVWIFAVFGFAYKSLNRPSKALSYLSQAAYPVYILHMVFLYLGSMLIMPLGIPALARFIFLVVFTIVGCFITYEVIRRIKFLRPLFGLRIPKL